MAEQVENPFEGEFKPEAASTEIKPAMEQITEVKQAEGLPEAVVTAEVIVPSAEESGIVPVDQDEAEVEVAGTSPSPVMVESKETAEAVMPVPEPSMMEPVEIPETRLETASFTSRVTDPDKKGEHAFTQFIMYQLRTTFADGKEVTVERRFSDFLWLAERLHFEFPCCLVPPVPPKSYMGRFTGDFIDERRRGLELFLSRIAHHALLSMSPSVAAFLEGDRDALAVAKKTKRPPEQRMKKQRGFMSMVKDSITSLSTSLGTAKERPPSEDDTACAAVVEDAAMLEKSLGALVENSTAVVERARGHSKALFELGLAAMVLGQYEGKQDRDALGRKLCALGTCLDKLSVQATKNADQTDLLLREPLGDQLRTSLSLSRTMKARGGARIRCLTSLATLENRQDTLAKAGADSAAAKKGAEAAQRQFDEDNRELDRISKLTLREAAHFNEDKAAGVDSFLKSFVASQIEHTKQALEEWEALQKEMDASDSQ